MKPPTLKISKKTQCFSMCLHIRHSKIYDTLTCDSCQKNVQFWPPKSSKIVPQTYKNRCWFFNRFLVRFLFDFGAHLGSILAPKPFQDAPSAVPRWWPERSLGAFCPELRAKCQKNPSKTVSDDKNRCEMTFRGSKYAFLSVRMALGDAQKQ